MHACVAPGESRMGEGLLQTCLGRRQRVVRLAPSKLSRVLVLCFQRNRLSHLLGRPPAAWLGGACAARGARSCRRRRRPWLLRRPPLWASPWQRFGQAILEVPRNPSLAEVGLVALPHKPLELGRRDPLLTRIRHPELPQLPVRVEQLPGVEQVGEEGSFAARMPVSIAPCAICMSVKDVASPVFACKS